MRKKLNFVLLWLVDILGILRGRTIPFRKLGEALENGVGFDGSSIPGFVSIEKSDLRMIPDKSTFSLLPFYFFNKEVGKFFCDVLTSDGKLFESYSREICRKFEKKLKYKALVAAELEFYLFKKAKGKILPIENGIEHNHYFDILPGRDLTESFRMELSEALDFVGLEIERIHHEVGPSQSEMTFKFSSPLVTSDNILTYKFVVKKVAEKFGWNATFMPKPWYGFAGNGMHIHISLFKGERNLFFDPNDGISQTCRYFIGGILEHARALSLIAAPTVNSYKRLVPGYEAPVYITWGWGNRSTLIRIPYYSKLNENSARIEFRCPDPLTNPYLLFPVVIGAGLDGVKRKIEPPAASEENVYVSKKRFKTLPSSLGEALEEWNNDDICIKILGKKISEKLVELLEKEWEEYKKRNRKNSKKITEWEIEKYLYR
jgi:glutamine synthetase